MPPAWSCSRRPARCSWCFFCKPRGSTRIGGGAGVGERIRNTVLDAGIAAPSGGLLSVSVGVAARVPGSTGEALLRQADAALYDAKHAGRNRVASWRSPEGAPIGSAYDDALD